MGGFNLRQVHVGARGELDWWLDDMLTPCQMSTSLGAIGTINGVMVTICCWVLGEDLSESVWLGALGWLELDIAETLADDEGAGRDGHLRLLMDRQMVRM